MTATGGKKYRTLDEATNLLAASRRDALKDDAFGDMEVSWFIGKKVIAYGYIGRTRKSVTICADESFAETAFADESAEKLELLGNKDSRTAFNDAGDPRR